MLQNKSVETNYGTVPYAEMGSGEKILVVGYGWSGSGKDYGWLERYFPNLRIIVPTLPFHPNGPKDLDPSLDSMGEYLSEVVTKIVPNERVSLLARSMGGSGLLRGVAMGRIRAERIMMVDVFTNPDKKGLIRKAGDWLSDSLINTIEYRRHPVTYAPLPPRELSKEMIKTILSLKFWRTGSQTVLTPNDIPDDIPVAAVWGSQDLVVSTSEFERSVEKRVPTVKLRGGHDSYRFEHLRFVENLRAFLETGKLIEV